MRRSSKNTLLLISFWLLYAPVWADVPGSLSVQYGDCAEVLAGPKCVLNDARTLRLWVRTEPGARITVDDGRRALSELARFDVDGGTHLQIEIPQRAARVRVRSTRQQSVSEWSIDLASSEPSAGIERARRLYLDGKIDDAEALLLQLVGDSDSAHSGGANRMAAMFYHVHGDASTTRRFYEQAVDRALAHGRWLEAIKAADGLSHLLQHSLRDFAAARDVYKPFTGLNDLPAEAGFFEHYDNGLLGFNTGDRRAALRELDMAARQAARMGTSGRWLQRRLDAEEVLASQLQRLGRRAEAGDYFDAWRARDLSAISECERAYFQSNLAWSTLLTLEAGDTAADPTPLLEQAIAVMREHCQPGDVASSEINLALAHYHARRFNESAAALARAADATQTPELRLRFWELDIGARLALARGETEVALALLGGMKALADATLSPDAAWRAAARRGVVFESLGLVDDALAAYAAADQRFENDLRHVPVYAGRGQFAATRDWVMRRRLGLLHARGAHDEIADLIRRAQLRTFDALSIEQQPHTPGRDQALAEYQRMRAQLVDEIGSGWRVPADELALLEARRGERESRLRELLDQGAHRTAPQRALHRPVPGDLKLQFHPLENGWLTVAITADSTVTFAPDCAISLHDPLALAQCLLDAAASQFAGAERLLITPSGALLNVDFHALRAGDNRLIDKLPILYSLDRGPAEPAVMTGGHALIIGDATRQLPTSRREAEAVASLLVASGRASSNTLLGAQADFTSVMNGLTQADLLHFAGHATYVSGNAWTSGLALARGEALTISDVLSLQHAPAYVVLSACDTARADAGSTAGMLGLAQAFVLRGTRAVVATSRPVRDAHAHAFSTAFYAHWQTGMPAAQALRRVQIELRQADEPMDWAAFRLVVP